MAGLRYQDKAESCNAQASQPPAIPQSSPGDSDRGDLFNTLQYPTEISDEDLSAPPPRTTTAPFRGIEDEPMAAQ